MANGSFVRTIRVRAFFAFLWMSVAGMCMVSPAYAAPSELLHDGTSGSCIWKYEQIDGETVLTFAPTEGTDGTLGVFSWNSSPYRETTRRVVVEGTVKMKSSTMAMFEGFTQARSMDLSGLDVTDVTNMCEMFYECHDLVLLDMSGWDVSNVRNMSYMFCYCFSLIALDVGSWDVSSMIDMKNMFHECHTLASLDVSKWNVSNVKSMLGTFARCYSLTSLDVGDWNVSNVTNMASMFHGCKSLTSLDLSRWNVSRKTLTRDMFVYTWSLGEIYLGIDFYLTDDIVFSSAGSRVGTKWMQVNLGKGGTQNNPKGKVFESSHDLLAFHHDRTKRETDTEMYIRVDSAQLTVSFSGDADDATGEMSLQVYDVGETKALTKNAYTRAGYRLICWKDSEGNVYADEQTFKNNYFGKAAQNGETPQRTLELVAQWDKIVALIYEVKDDTQITLSYAQEELGSTGDPLGSEVTAEVPHDKQVIWTVKEGGADAASTWTYKGPKLGKDEIRAVAQKHGKLVPTTFVAELVDKIYTITFELNAPSETKVTRWPSSTLIKHGQDAEVPTDILVSRSGYRFTGEWATSREGTGVLYKAGDKIRNVSSPIILYAQWKKVDFADEMQDLYKVISRVSWKKLALSAVFPFPTVLRLFFG